MNGSVSRRQRAAGEESRERKKGWRAHAPVRVPRYAQGLDARVGEERPEEVEHEEEVRRRPGDEAVELGRAAAAVRRGERRVRRERRGGRGGPVRVRVLLGEEEDLRARA